VEEFQLLFRVRVKVAKQTYVIDLKCFAADYSFEHPEASVLLEEG
jgi:hypothetical protein